MGDAESRNLQIIITNLVILLSVTFRFVFFLSKFRLKFADPVFKSFTRGNDLLMTNR